MYRITDPERSRGFYEALGLRVPPRTSDCSRRRARGEVLLGYARQEEELELTFNHDGRSYELGTAYGHLAVAVDDLDGTLARLAEQGIEPDRAPYRVREGGSRLTFVDDPDG
jgi:lactoylglutathione lyase